MHYMKTTVFDVLSEIVAYNKKLGRICKGLPKAQDLCDDISYKADQLRRLCEGLQERADGLELELRMRDAQAAGTVLPPGLWWPGGNGQRYIPGTGADGGSAPYMSIVEGGAAMENTRPNGYLSPTGEYVRLSDLEGMERALQRLFNGDMTKVSNGLREVSLELAKECEDAAAREFLASAREIGGCGEAEGPEMLRLGLAFEGIRRFDFAGECYEYGRSLGRCDHLPWYFLHNNHAYCLGMLERFTEAEPLAREAIRIDPKRHNAHKNLGLALLGQGRLSESADSFRIACGLCPHDERAAHYLAIVEERLRGTPGKQPH